MHFEDRDECPECQITWRGVEIPDGLMEHNPDYYPTREKAEEAADSYGWTPENKLRFRINVIGVEYPYNHPQHYDGVSEWRCTNCGLRIGRFSGAFLKDDEVEGWCGTPRPVKDFTLG
jgi:hypothetical protein